MCFKVYLSAVTLIGIGFLVHESGVIRYSVKQVLATSYTSCIKLDANFLLWFKLPTLIPFTAKTDTVSS